MNKKKIINDPVHGFVNIPNALIYDLMQHPYFQRLRRIKQLGLSEYIYPGALHTRFHHALGAMHLMTLALDNLASKGFNISQAEREAAQIAILLHDVGHGPFSHALEFVLLKDIEHESFSLLIMEKLNQIFKGKLSLAIEIFTNRYSRKFFHQLVSSQLDMDRMDYLLRDSFFTGVSEGKIGSDRIIKMLTLKDDELLVEEKGIYSIENFLTARRLMYWQVYLHKTNLAIEQMLIQLLRRAKTLVHKEKDIFASPALLLLIKEQPKKKDFLKNPKYLEAFLDLDDYDMWSAIKAWTQSKDPVLSKLSQMLLHRKPFKSLLSKDKPDPDWVKDKSQVLLKKMDIKPKHLSYFLVQGSTINRAYQIEGNKIKILTKKGEVKDIAQASDLPNIKALRRLVKKHFICWAEA